MCVIVLDDGLSTGIIANTATALGLSLGNHVSGLIGADVVDSDGITHRGVTAVPIPILAVDKEVLNRLYHTAMHERDEVLTIGFSKTAQRCNVYEDYIKKVEESSGSDFDYLGICIYGPKKR